MTISQSAMAIRFNATLIGTIRVAKSRLRDASDFQIPCPFNNNITTTIIILNENCDFSETEAVLRNRVDQTQSNALVFSHGSDFDECKAGAQCKDNEFCFNTYGSYRCIAKLTCPSDYEQVSDK